MSWRWKKEDESNALDEYVNKRPVITKAKVTNTMRLSSRSGRHAVFAAREGLFVPVREREALCNKLVRRTAVGLRNIVTIHYLIFKEANASNMSIAPTIQNRTITLGSAMPSNSKWW